LVIVFLINNKTWRKNFCSFPLVFWISFVSAEKSSDAQEIFPVHVQGEEQKRAFTWANLNEPANAVDQFFSPFCPCYV